MPLDERRGFRERSAEASRTENAPEAL